MKSIRAEIQIMVMVVAVALMLFACGGGGGGGSAGTRSTSGGYVIGPAPATTLTVDENNAAKLMGAAMFGQAVGGAAGSGGGTPLQAPEINAVLPNRLMQAVLARAREESMAGSNDFPSFAKVYSQTYCSYGGTLEGEMTWEGPDEPTDCSQVVDAVWSATAHNCEEVAGTLMNGGIHIFIHGDLCRPSGMTLTLNNFSLSDSSANLSFFSRSMMIRMKGITYSPGGSFITHAETVVYGDVGGSMDGVSYETEYHGLTEIMGTSDNIHFTFDISGSVRRGCLGSEWAAIETIQTIESTGPGNCNTAGEVWISGTGDIDIVYHADGSVKVGMDNYASCDLLDTECPGP